MLDLSKFIGTIIFLAFMYFGLFSDKNPEIEYVSIFFLPLLGYLFVIFYLLAFNDNKKIIKIELRLCLIIAICLALYGFVLFFYPIKDIEVHKNSGFLLILVSLLFFNIIIKLEKLLLPTSNSEKNQLFSKNQYKMLLKNILDLIKFIGIPILIIILNSPYNTTPKIAYINSIATLMLIFLFLIWDILTFNKNQKILKIKIKICVVGSLGLILFGTILFVYPVEELGLQSSSGFFLLSIGILFSQITINIKKLLLSTPDSKKELSKN